MSSTCAASWSGKECRSDRIDRGLPILSGALVDWNERTHRLTAEKSFGISYGSVSEPLFTLLGMGARWSGVTVTDTEVRVRMGIGFNAVIPRDHIKEAGKATKPALFGWGVHGWLGRWAVNGSDRGMVRLRIDPPVHARMLIFAIRPHELYISLNDPDGFLAAVGQ